jgi:hypothetical protein
MLDVNLEDDDLSIERKITLTEDYARAIVSDVADLYRCVNRFSKGHVRTGFYFADIVKKEKEIKELEELISLLMKREKQCLSH